MFFVQSPLIERETTDKTLNQKRFLHNTSHYLWLNLFNEATKKSKSFLRVDSLTQSVALNFYCFGIKS